LNLEIQTAKKMCKSSFSLFDEIICDEIFDGKSRKFSMTSRIIQKKRVESKKNWSRDCERTLTSCQSQSVDLFPEDRNLRVDTTNINRIANSLMENVLLMIRSVDQKSKIRHYFPSSMFQSTITCLQQKLLIPPTMHYWSHFNLTRPSRARVRPYNCPKKRTPSS